MDGRIDLVAGRACGACNACCTHLVIADVGIDKLPGALCGHWRAGSGCSIYETRPNVCRTYHCGWRCLADLGEEWRPDRSGIMINFRSAPDQAPGEMIAHLLVVGGAEVAKSRHFAGLAASMVDGGTITHFVVPGAPGTPGQHVVLNPRIAGAVAAGSIEQVQRIIGDLYEALPATP